MNRPRSSTLIVGLIAAALVASPVTATHNIGWRWIYLPDGCYLHYVRYNYTSRVPNGDFKSRFIDARTTWNSVGTELRFAYHTNDVRLTVDYESYPGEHDDALAQTQHNWIPVGELHHVEIDINLRYDAAFYRGSGAVPGNMYDLETVMLHELGHGVELHHTYNNINHIMWGNGFALGFSNRDLATHDINGIEQMYGAEWGC